MNLEADFFVEPVSWQFDEVPISAIRRSVFIEEQQVPEEEEWDDHDATAQHFLARTLAGEVIGTARLTLDGHIGRMAVVKDWRGRKVGDALLRTAIEFAQGRGLAEVRLMAQTYALEFYARHGFTAYGEVFDDVGIPHQWMQRTLAVVDHPPELPRRQVSAERDKQRIDIDSRRELTTQLGWLIQSTGHALALFTHQLEPRILDTRSLVENIRQLCTAGSGAQIRILVKDSRPAVQAGHPLIALGQQLPSMIQFRLPDKEHQEYPAAFAVGDENHLLFRPFANQYGGYHERHHRREARRLLEFFDAAWEQAVPDPNFRRLAL